MEFVIKAYLRKADSNEEVRRIPVSVADQGNNKDIFKETFAKIGKAFPELLGKIYSLKWKDSDGDLVMMSSDEEIAEALSQTPNSPLKVFITVEGMKEAGFENLEGAKDDGQPPNADDSAKNHEREEPIDAGWSFDGPMGMPDFGFGGPVNFPGMSGTRKRGHPDSHNPRGHFGLHFGHLGPRGHHFDHLGPRGHHARHMGPSGHHFGQPDPRCNIFGNMGPRGHHFDNLGPRGHYFGHMGPHGHHFDNLGPRGHHFGHMGPRGHPFDNLGPRGHHFGHFGPRGHHGFGGNHDFGIHMEMHGPFGGHDFFEGQQPCSNPFQDPCMFFGFHQGDHHEDNGWKSKLRNAVPVAHRRWAKQYIRSWRVQNLKNATSTSGESDQETFTMQDASVPEAYATWLDIFLLKWHKLQGQSATEVNTDKGKDSEEKTKLKASVPKEFRKWTKWYLARHFGKKEAPKFYEEGHFEGKVGKLRNKMQKLAASIPPEHCKWAKTFIHDWRQEHNVPDSKTATGDAVSSENEDAEKKADGSEITVPADYAKWMRKFLTRWHLWRGLIDGQKVELENGDKGEFKDAVPKNFRKWVKCFLWCQYGKGAAKEGSNSFSQYQKWLQAFQQKWLHEQSKEGSSDELVLTSSDEETSAEPSSADIEMESSLKKLRLQADAEKNAHASSSRLMHDSDNSDAEVNPDFQQWFQHALWQWDGKTAPNITQEEASGSEQISPYLYNKMSKMMMKMHMKRMKQELKSAKHSMKAAMKAQKHGHF